MPDQANSQQVSLYTFVNNTPAPVVRLLIELAPLIAFVRRVAQVLSWSSGTPSESWLAVGLWWALCLSIGFSVRYLLPAVILVPLAVKTLAPRLPFLKRFTNTQSTTVRPPPTTESAISQTLADIHAIQSLLPRIPSLPDLPPSKNVLRIVGIIHVPYVIIVRVISVKILVAIIGTCFLTWRSPWASTSRKVLLRSGWVQWGIHRAWVALSGLPPSSSPFGPQQRALTLTTDAKRAGASEPQYDLPAPVLLHFQFTVFENQRWWMGLDFTAALLPGDRPSWCSPPPTMSGLPPPGSLSLPGPTTVYLPITNSSTGSASSSGLRMKRTSKWKWDEADWGVTVRTTAKDGTMHEERVKMEPPTETDLHPGGNGGGNAARLVDVVGKGLRRAQNASGDNGHHGSPVREDSIFHRLTAPLDTSSTPSIHALPSETDLTDTDGWVYADNKWEGGSALRGRGKYTRYRRWTRVAVLEETIEVVDGMPSTLPDTIPHVEEPESMLSSPAGRNRESSPLRRRVTTASDS